MNNTQTHMQNEQASTAEVTPGRSCPLHYRYSPSVFASAVTPELKNLDVLYIVGGLYGNELALLEVLRLFEQETGNKKLVFNGDFHWFDKDPATFMRIQQSVLTHTAIRGNVETELGSDEMGLGCGCAYPEWVEESVVSRSNRIIDHLRQCATPEIQAQLNNLPMWCIASLGHHRIGIVHGDAESLAGWGFAQEHLQSKKHRQAVGLWFEQAHVDFFASSHTCLPVLQAIMLEQEKKVGWVLNNGAAGLPNFQDDHAGLLTRISTTHFNGKQSRASVQHQGLYLDLVGIETDQVEVQKKFLAQWPVDSDAHHSYFSRIISGPKYKESQVIRKEDRVC